MQKYPIPEKIRNRLQVDEEINVLVYISQEKSLITRGVHWPAYLAKIRYFYIPEIKNAKKPVVVLYRAVRGRCRTKSQMDATLVHELIHVRQMKQKSRKLFVGCVIIIGSIILINTLILIYLHPICIIPGILAGYMTGYRLAPHEIEARGVTKQILHELHQQ